jgi:hypothetical protein
MGAGALPDSYLNTRMTLFDTDGLTVLQDNDDILLKDAGIHYMFGTPGTYYVRVERTGASQNAAYAMTFTVTTPNPIGETETNDNIGQADNLDFDFGTGAITSSDTDIFTFNGSAGDLIWVQEYDAANLQGFPVNAAVSILKSDGTPVPSASGGALQQTHRTVLPTTGAYFIQVTGIGGSTGSFAVGVVRVRTAAVESEPNNTNLQAGTLDLNGRASGIIATAGDEDRFQFTAGAGELVTFAVYTKSSGGAEDIRGNGSSLEAQLDLVDGAGTILVTSSPPTIVADEAISPGSPEPTREVSFVAPTAGTYYVRVTDVLGSGSASHWYILERR